MTFLVESVTPGQLRDHYNTGVDRTLRTALPFEVEVLDSMEKRDSTYPSTCRCESVFRVSDEGVRRLKKYGLFRKALHGRMNPCVCMCMGKTVGA